MRIAIIGAGVTTPLLLGSLLLQSDSLSLDHVVIHDRSPARSAAISRLIRLLNARRPRIVIDATSSLDDVVRARPDCCIISIRPGLEAGRSADELRAKQAGLLANETVGPAGLVFACRAIPAATRIATRIVAASPECLIINFTNPAGLVTAAMRAAGIMSAYGVCSSADKAARLLAADPDVGPSRLLPRVFGLNHLSWTHSLLRDGVEFLPEVLSSSRYLEVGQPWFDPALPMRHGALLNEYLYYYYMHDAAMTRQEQQALTRGETVLRLNEALRTDLHATTSDEQASARYLRYVTARKESYMDGLDHHASAEPRYEDDDGYSLPALSLLHAVALRTTCQVSCISTADTAGELPANVGIEATRLFRDGAPEPLPTPSLSAEAWSLIRRVAEYESAALDAISAQDTDALIEALELHPLVPSRTHAIAFLRSSVTFWPQVYGSWSSTTLG